MKTADDVLAALDLSLAAEAQPFHLSVGPVGVSVYCADALRSELMGYFADALTEKAGEIRILLLPEQTLVPEPRWSDWQREPNKPGRKDAVFDLRDGRLIRKVRSGVTFLQSRSAMVAFGDLSGNVSTVINFVNTQILNVCLHDGWQLCHAAAITGSGRTLAISGLSGGGKSTSILRMMDFEGTRFVSNDRLLVKEGLPPHALGIPKHPRINPGTMIGNPRLQPMLTAERRGELEAMPAGELWDLEEKYDLIIPDIYGPNRVQYEAPLTDFWVLNWSRGNKAPTQVSAVDLQKRPDLLSAIMKSPGPFYQKTDGRFEPNGSSCDPTPYLQALQGLRVSEVSGRVDFDALADYGRELFNA